MKYLFHDVTVLKIVVPNLAVPLSVTRNDERVTFGHYELYMYVKSYTQSYCANTLGDNFRFERLEEDKNFAIYIHNPGNDNCEEKILDNLQKLYEDKVSDYKKKCY